MTASLPAAPPPSSGRPRFWTVSRKLVAAFWLVSVIPTMIAAELVASSVSEVFDDNVRVWLNESTKIVWDEIEETRDENTKAAQFFLENASMATSPDSEQSRVMLRVAQTMGIDVVALMRADDHAIVFCNTSLDILRQLRPDKTALLQTIETAHGREAVIISTFELSEGDEKYLLLVGEFLDASFLTSVADVHSLDLRLYLPSGSRYEEVFATQRFRDHPTVVPLRVQNALTTTKAATEDFNPRYSGLYSPLLDNGGKTIGIVFTGLLRGGSIIGLVNQTNIFLLVFLLGSALSIGAGWLVSRRLARPLLGLLGGVRAITSGDYAARVPVIGKDELAELSTTFNLMASRLDELRDLEVQLRRRDRLRTLGEVAMGLAHEIRNPLGIIKTATELLRRRLTGATPADIRHLDYVVSEVGRINGLITEFLDFAKPRTPQRTAVPVRRLIDDLVGFCAPEFANRGIAVAVEDAVPDASVYADGQQIKQVCLNLFLNAIDAMPEGGRLSVRIKGEEQGWTRIEITDTGVGIPSELIDHVFTPFVTNKAQGTGLGLAKVFSIVENHEGRVECRNEPAGGTTFILSLPNARPREP